MHTSLGQICLFASGVLIGVLIGTYAAARVIGRSIGEIIGRTLAEGGVSPKASDMPPGMALIHVHPVSSACNMPWIATDVGVSVPGVRLGNGAPTAREALVGAQAFLAQKGLIDDVNTG